jgi:gas vesicle protein
MVPPVWGPDHRATIQYSEDEGHMEEMSRDNGTGIVLAAVVGAAVGAGVALLFAPCSGRELRDWLYRRSRELKDTASEVIEQGAATIRRTAEDLSREAGSAADLRGKQPYR